MNKITMIPLICVLILSGYFVGYHIGYGRADDFLLNTQATDYIEVLNKQAIEWTDLLDKCTEHIKKYHKSTP